MLLLVAVKFFNFHPLLNILAFGVATTESLISFKAFGLRHTAAKTVHGCLQLASFLLGIAAFTVVILFHNSNEFPNFYSVHSWIGLTVYALSWCQFLSGLLIFWLPGFAPGSVKAAYIRYHKIGGIVIYSGALAAVCSGLMQKQSFLRNNSPKAPLFGTANILANALGVTAVLILFAVLAVLGFENISSHRSLPSPRTPESVPPEDGDLRAFGSAADTERLRPRTPNRRARQAGIFYLSRPQLRWLLKLLMSAAMKQASFLYGAERMRWVFVQTPHNNAMRGTDPQRRQLRHRSRRVAHP
ncbi:Cytochrome b reductase 1, related [Eimeria praecox]|uniref:Cytochrome b reductase 1, related n=1 Tax=Eimeria praecox TaxID=51316 RepID=U6H4P3_9EIME|nr:Cytochrome b reductase 1, related [Eimeria praecox]